MEFRVLGTLEVVDDGRALELRGQKQRALLALLLLDANRPVSRDRLIDALWEDGPTPTAAKALQVYISQLRKTLGHNRVVTAPGGYVLRADPEEIDRERCRRLVEEGKPREAVALWRGEPLAEFAQLRFAQPDIAELEELHLACVEARIEADLAEGRNVIGELEALVEKQPLREHLHELLLLALYRSGRQADALAAYQDARNALVERLGIEPGKPLRDLQQAILRQDPALDLAPAARARSTFVGREAELSQLVAGLDEAIVGRGRLFLLVGEPGIGKSRLAEELIQIARARRVDVLVGRCWEASGAPAYWPWVQSLRSLADGAPPELAALLRDEPTESESESARFRLFDATTRFLASRERPLLLFLDDMHAADEPSLLLLQFLARELAHARILVLVACRDVDPVPGRELAAMLAEVAREPTTMRLLLRGLSEEAVADYVEAELASRELASTLYEGTDGNPLFLGETVRLLAVEGRVAIPQTVRDVIARRLSHLSEKCNQVLALASVLGGEFALDALAQMENLEEDALLEVLEEAAAARVVSDAPGAHGRLRFAHVLIRDTLYESLSTPRRVRAHRLAVESLEQLYGEDAGPHLSELAHHAIAGSEFGKARICAQLAGDRALALLAYEEAARLYGVALEALKLEQPGDEQTRCELLLLRGEAEIRAGDTTDAKATFVAAAAIARRLGLPRELARAAAGYGGRIVWSRAGRDELLVPLLEEGLAKLAADDVELRPRLLGRLAGALRDERPRERRDRLSREAVELARRSGDPATLAYSLAGRALANAAPETITECLALGTEVCELSERSGDIERAVSGHSIRVMANLILGNRAAAEEEVVAAARIADELRQPPQLWDVCATRAMLALGTGRFTEAEALVPQALTLGERALPDAAIPIYWMHRSTYADFHGGLEAVEPAIRELSREYPARPVFACALVYLCARLGELEEAARLLEPLTRDECMVVPVDQEWLYATSFLAEAAAIVGDAASALALLRLLRPWRKLNAVDLSEGVRGSISRYLGLATVTLGRWDEAENHFDEALAMNERMGFRPWLARTREDFASLLRRRGEPGDADRAAELEGAALAMCTELGMARTGAAPA
jgi:DNA-binding SARP family transcriptional activator/tetratricopeptide (TPR) repeat protein